MQRSESFLSTFEIIQALVMAHVSTFVPLALHYQRHLVAAHNSINKSAAGKSNYCFENLLETKLTYSHSKIQIIVNKVSKQLVNIMHIKGLIQLINTMQKA